MKNNGTMENNNNNGTMKNNNNELTIFIVSWKETNEHYDSSRSSNGGGYSQPEIVLSFSDGTMVTIYDMSCGEYGGRVSVSIRWQGEKYGAYYGSMLREEEESSDISFERWSLHLMMIEEKLGYKILTEEEYEEQERKRYEYDLYLWEEEHGDEYGA